MQPRYPVYVPSKGRWDMDMNWSTVKFLLKDEVPFRLVVEPSEAEDYARAFPGAELLITPHDDMRLLGVRNWIRDHSGAAGAARHWQLDDNIMDIRRLYRGKRLPCHSGTALRCVEDFTDRYTNIGIAGLNYQMFVLDETAVPFVLNVHVYSCCLISNEMPYRHRLLYNDDTDLCLQVLAGGLCTVAFNVFMAHKRVTMAVGGGNTADLYQGDGRLRMARTLERQWPGVVTTARRFKRAQHVVKDAWRKFDTPLIRRADVDFDALPDVDEYGLTLAMERETIQSPVIRRIYDEYHATPEESAGKKSS